MTTTFSELKEQVGSVVGSCSDEKKSELAISVLRYLHNEGAFGLYRKWKLFATECSVTLPPDLDMPKKVSINGNPRPVQDFWHEFNDVNSYDAAEYHNDDYFCTSEGGGIRVEADFFATSCDLPCEGGYVYMAPIQTPNAPLYVEKDDLEAIIHGTEVSTQRDVVLAHDNTLSRGERLNISAEKPLFSTIQYGKITNLIKPQTLNRYGLFWKSHKSDPAATGGLLAELGPFETKARFRRAYIPGLSSYYQDYYKSDSHCQCGVYLTILGTIRIKDHYDDNELLPFCEGVDFKLAAKALHGVLNASNSDELNVALRQKQEVEQNINKEWDKQTVHSSPINVINFRKRKLNKVH